MLCPTVPRPEVAGHRLPPSSLVKGRGGVLLHCPVPPHPVRGGVPPTPCHPPPLSLVKGEGGFALHRPVPLRLVRGGVPPPNPPRAWSKARGGSPSLVPSLCAWSEAASRRLTPREPGQRQGGVRPPSSRPSTPGRRQRPAA